MADKKSILASLFGGGCSCGMSVVEDQKSEKKKSCCDMEIVEESAHSCCDDYANVSDPESGCCENNICK